MSSPVSILISGHDASLLQTRRLVFEKAGFRVMTIHDLAVAAKTLSHRSIDVSILCHTLAAQECEIMIAEVHSACPAAKIVLLKTNGRRRVQGDYTIVNAFDGPEKLIETVEKLMNS